MPAHTSSFVANNLSVEFATITLRARSRARVPVASRTRPTTCTIKHTADLSQEEMVQLHEVILGKKVGRYEKYYINARKVADRKKSSLLRREFHTVVLSTRQKKNHVRTHVYTRAHTCVHIYYF